MIDLFVVIAYLIFVENFLLKVC